MRTTILASFLLINLVNSHAQNQFSIPDVMPSVAKQTQATSAGDAKMFILFEQFGELPNEQKASCTPTSPGTIKVKVEHYASGGKFMFDQIMQSKRIELDMGVYENGYENQQSQYAGNTVSTISELTKKEVAGGKSLSYTITTKCDDKSLYNLTTSLFYIVLNTTIIYIDFGYSGSASTLENYAKEAVDKIKKIDFGKL